MAACRFCGAEIRWCKLVDRGDAAIALNIAPEPAGSYQVAGVDSAMFLPRERRGSRPLYRKHAETCERRADAAAYYRQQHAGKLPTKGAALRGLAMLEPGPIVSFRRRR